MWPPAGDDHIPQSIWEHKLNLVISNKQTQDPTKLDGREVGMDPGGTGGRGVEVKMLKIS